MYKGIAANRIVRLNVDGSLSLFRTGFSNGAVNVIKVVSTGSIMEGLSKNTMVQMSID
jgi:hypothetical protein